MKYLVYENDNGIVDEFDTEVEALALCEKILDQYRSEVKEFGEVPEAAGVEVYERIHKTRIREWKDEDAVDFVMEKEDG